MVMTQQQNTPTRKRQHKRIHRYTVIETAKAGDIEHARELALKMQDQANEAEARALECQRDVERIARGEKVAT